MAIYELAAMMVVIFIAACREIKKYNEPKK